MQKVELGRELPALRDCTEQGLVLAQLATSIFQTDCQGAQRVDVAGLSYLQQGDSIWPIRKLLLLLAAFKFIGNLTGA